MKLTKYSPFEMGNVFDDFFTDFFNRPFSSLSERMTGNSPAVNVAEEDDHYAIELAAPGLEKNDFDLKVENNMLTVKVEKEFKDEESDDKFTRREFNYTRFSRSFHLPETVKADDISAEYKNGVLHVILPKEETAKALPVRTISIN